MASPTLPSEKLPGEGLPETPLDLLEISIYRVGLAPVVIEWFFRGVILERLRRHFGVTQAIIGSASLCAVATALPGDQASGYVSQLSFYFLSGLILGYMRFSAGSILPGILFSAGMQGVAAFTTSLGEALIIPGFNTAGGHSSGWLILPSLISVGLGLVLVRRFRKPDEAESS
jgi:membrane protease YdiL (CAAX protease family)